MKVLVIGSGGREHAIIKKLKENEKIDEIFAAPGNGGISADAVCVGINATDIDGVIKFSKDNKIDLVCVTPDNPLALGMVDALENEGIKAFGPSKKAAEIESSKVFSKNLMKKYGIKTASYETFNDKQSAIDYVSAYENYPVVIKADGLALGKGVIIAENREDAIEAIISMMEDKAFGSSGDNIVIEEFLTGVEVSVLAFTDGKCIKPMISSMDHKRALDGDEGLNTGGMGVIAPNPYYTPEIEKICMDEVFIPTMNAMNKEGRTFKGVLYFGLMLTKNGVYVIEYNCRFGDPETQVCLSLLKSDLLTIMKAVVDGKLSDVEVINSDEAAACVIMASGGYPTAYEKGFEISGLDSQGQCQECVVYHAGTKTENSKYFTNGGRVLGVTSIGKNLEIAVKNAYKCCDNINFKNAHYRKDIGSKALNPIIF